MIRKLYDGRMSFVILSGLLMGLLTHVYALPTFGSETILNAGDYHSCGLKADGSVACWGNNASGQATAQSGPFTQISAGSFHTCGLKPDGSVACWGDDSFGGTEGQAGPFTQISTGWNHSCGLKPDGGVDCWGWNDLGQAEDQTGPFTQISTSENHNCGLKPDGSAVCWGDNSFGGAENQTGPFTQITAGWHHSCGLRVDGSVDCWGDNSNGRADDQSGPFTQISAAYSHSCGLKPDGNVACWGDNSNGQTDAPTGPFIQISAGGGHTCGLRLNGSVDCWGYNEFGQAEDQAGPFAPYQPPNAIARVSVDSNGAEGNADSFSASLSDNGRFVAFLSDASNLVSGDSNGTSDVFVHDRDTGETTRVSVDSNGNEQNGQILHLTISGNGRFVAFSSNASNLVSGDNNGLYDIFVHDRETGTTERVSVSSDGEANGDSIYPRLSSNGRLVAFASSASNLVPNDTNGVTDVFVYDREAGTTERVSVDNSGHEGNGVSSFAGLSGNGRFVTFWSLATNLAGSDTNDIHDVFVHDRETGTTERVSVDSDGNEGNGRSINPVISNNGRFVAFHSLATNLVNNDTNGNQDVFVHDRQTGMTERVSVSSSGLEGNGGSDSAGLSNNGRFVTFQSTASNLVIGDNNNSGDVFVRDRETGITKRVSLNSSGDEGNEFSAIPNISRDGRFVAFHANASNLVSGDNNNAVDIFVAEQADSDPYISHLYLPLQFHSSKP